VDEVQRHVKLALLQMHVEPGAKGANLARAAHWLERAAQAGANVALLPEAFTLGWTHPSARTEADGIPDGETCVFLRLVAKRWNLHICAGIVERAGERIFNTAVLVDPTGRVLLHHRKINELDIATDLYARGDRLGVADTEFGRLGLMICADAFAPGQVISRSLGLMGARGILSPSAWAVPAEHDNAREPYGQLWLDNYCPVAREFNLWIAGCSNVGPITAGPWAERRCIGNSLVIGVEGQELARGSYDAEQLIMVEL
jgi:predicted amidohydrolase